VTTALQMQDEATSGAAVGALLDRRVRPQPAAGALALGVDDPRFRPVLVDWCHSQDKVGALIAGVGVQMSLFMEFGGSREKKA